MDYIKLTTPLSPDIVATLKAGNRVLLSGVIYTARDAAHKKMQEALSEGKELPFDIKNNVIYYAGPCPAKEDEVIGSCGPTTSGRMDFFAPTLISLGLTGMIGKGTRSNEVYTAMKEHKAVYFGATGGCGALIAKCVKSVKEIAYSELLTESVKELVVEDFPLTVIADCYGNCLYDRD